MNRFSWLTFFALGLLVLGLCSCHSPVASPPKEALCRIIEVVAEYPNTWTNGVFRIHRDHSVSVDWQGKRPVTGHVPDDIFQRIEKLLSENQGTTLGSERVFTYVLATGTSHPRPPIEMHIIHHYLRHAFVDSDLDQPEVKQSYTLLLELEVEIRRPRSAP